jgi:hypothetical protein
VLIPYYAMEQLEKDIVFFIASEMGRENCDTPVDLLGSEKFEFDFTYFLEGKLLELKRFLLSENSSTS